ncbi:FAD-binding and (Fe-S)-binding domain-containing protein [Nocardioides sp. YIM 152315]|uniref:FAD-binding and (Fe-S)-binding domain-containing protein n=1 Tax=Nocardioides sp. YIM 152315 TaxID=3031760 RepID=UPI0023D9C197|nr:FAD-binding and (Fe-S)-binding domain-containing protein [Nocardioides sp. YIM 152315]MDF1601940.1 FAD-binding and (Fe-S)-binding domain-containing protein [Nocardioides sp. YIM 152315]
MITPSTDAAVRALRDRVDGEVRFDAGSRAAYSTDASNFRQVPIGVVIPRTIEAAVAAVAVCHEHDLPVVSRGGGTSLAGQCTNTAVVLDFSKHCNRLVSVDVDARRCVVEPGIVLDDLNRQLAPTGLRFGPEPATHQNCTLGGMIGNNSCGATAQRTGKVVDNVASLDVLLHDGTRFVCGPTDDETYAAIERRGDRRAHVYRALRRLRDEHADLIRARYPDIPRRVSGYNLDSLLPEHGFDVAGLLVGSESTLVTVLRAELELVPVVPARSLVVLGFPDIATAADAVPAIVEHEPIALEGVDRFLIRDQQLKGMNAEALDRLPEGTGFLLAQFGGDDADEADRRAQEMLDALGESDHGPEVAFVDDPEREDELWQVRESGLGATAHVPHRRDTWEGWEDSAVPVDRLGDYLRDLRGLYEEFGYASDVGPSLYGHFGQGCVHTRIPFDLFSAGGVATYRRFLERAADLVAAYGGSLSGEHGDGQTRGELLPRMFGAEVVGLFEEVKALLDPGDRMNPGKVVRPARLDEHLRLGASWSPRPTEGLYFGYPHDGHSFQQAANRCVGVGKCRKHENDGGTVMCPSYQVTGEEEHSTRGRARLLFEMLDGHGDGPVTDGWRSTEVRDALDLCLACKGCKTDCPANVDMATYKAEFLAQHYRHRLRPRADYATGWLPLVAGAVTRSGAARAVNALGRRRPLARLATRAAGLEDRTLPEFAEETLQQWWARREHPARGDTRGTVLLWPDTFTNDFDPRIGRAAVRVLEEAGWRVEIPTGPVCCGLTWISTGQLAVARRVLRRTVRRLAPHVRAGGLVVGLEPSCTAVFRSDLPELFPDDQDVHRLRDRTVTLAELLGDHTDGWTPPRLDGVRAMAQVHCHQHAVLGWDADRDLLERCGAEVERLDSGCCGLAGNFGFTAGHGEVSRLIAEQTLLPRLREADPGTGLLADGFSCRTQVHDLGPGAVEGMHLAELLASGYRETQTEEDTRGGEV